MRKVNTASRELPELPLKELTRAMVAHNLAIKLFLRWRESEHKDSETDASESFGWFQEAMNLTPYDHPSKYL